MSISRTPEQGYFHAENMIAPGSVVEVMAMSNESIFVGTVEWVKGNSIQITDSSGNVLPYIEYNSKVKFRAVSNALFLTVSGVVHGTSKTYWRLDDLQLLQTEERRQHYRQTTSLQGQVMCVNSLFGVENNNDAEKSGTFSCRVVDLSTTGIRIRTDGKYEKGDMLFLVDIRISPYEPAMTVTAIVRRAIPNETDTDYGCEFYGLSQAESQAISRIVLDIQRKELRSRRASYDY